VAFNVFRRGDKETHRLNQKSITNAADFVDTSTKRKDATYWVETINGQDRTTSETAFVKAVGGDGANYHRIKLKDPNVTAGRVAVADLNGDGKYDYIIRHPNSNVDPGVRTPDDGTTYKIEAYLHDGTYLWTMDLGLGIEPG